jgi:Tol biopolymer transport system component
MALVAGLAAASFPGVGLHSSASASATALDCMTRSDGTIAFERITFLSEESGSEVGDVWLVRPDGSDQRNLTGGDRISKDGRPAWSPDGRHIAFVSYGNRGGVFVMERDGGDVRKLTPNLAWDPSWSSSGRMLVVASQNGPGSSRVGVVSARGGPVRWLTRRNLDAAHPDWARSGQIAFIRYTGWRDKTLEVFAMSRDGTGQRRLTYDRSSDATPAWSPDAKEIAYHSDRGIVIMKADGSGTRRLTRGSDDYGPAWSPDGRCIAFGRGGRIYVVGVDGGAPQKLMERPRLGQYGGIDGAPAWTARR